MMANLPKTDFIHVWTKLDNTVSLSPNGLSSEALPLPLRSLDTKSASMRRVVRMQPNKTKNLTVWFRNRDASLYCKTPFRMTEFTLNDCSVNNDE
jgi:hypothetical protein